MKKLIKLLLALAIVVSAVDLGVKYTRASDSFVRDRVVQLKGNGYACTGIQVKAPSGKVYTLTAKHCRDMVDASGMVESTNEQGKKSMIRFIGVSPTSDLMLLTAASQRSIAIADKTYLHQHIHTLTHGAINPTYRTDGEFLNDQVVNVPIFGINAPEDFDKCQLNGNHIAVIPFQGLICFMQLSLRFSTAMVVGGSSGGPALDDAGSLVGIVSVSDGGIFSGLVRLEDIRSFLKAK